MVAATINYRMNNNDDDKNNDNAKIRIIKANKQYVLQLIIRSEELVVTLSIEVRIICFW